LLQRERSVQQRSLRFSTDAIRTHQNSLKRMMGMLLDATAFAWPLQLKDERFIVNVA
jgi:hypothetical protein